MTDNKYIFSTEIKVRDYELDSEGIVNNAIYLHYLEWTRHEFCDMAGFPFGKMANEGIVPVARRIEVDYYTPLRSGDIMVSSLWVERQGVRFIFHQDIFNKATNERVVSAVVTIVSIENGRLGRGERFAEFFKPYLA